MYKLLEPEITRYEIGKRLLFLLPRRDSTNPGNSWMESERLNYVNRKQMDYIKANPEGHCKNLLNYVNEFLDYHGLPEVPKWTRVATDHFYLSIPMDKARVPRNLNLRMKPRKRE